MSLYKSNYYESRTGRSEIEEFINSLDIHTQVRFFAKRGLLEEYGPRLPRPHAAHLEDGIYELRFTSSQGKVRVLYFFFYKNKIIFTNGFIKKTNKVPRREIKLAKERREDFYKRTKER